MSKKLWRVSLVFVFMLGTISTDLRATHQDPNKNSGAPFGFIEYVDMLRERSLMQGAKLELLLLTVQALFNSASSHIGAAAIIPIGHANYPEAGNELSDYENALEPIIGELLSAKDKLYMDYFHILVNLKALHGLLREMKLRLDATPDHT